ncbi:LytTR family DNA-binding domain-containing protein [Cytophagaceae bacterium ABcell3]|nr:LytTR family DNA-binding domain-containing protein [Cytophagaceae bacterium ABcell3]
MDCLIIDDEEMSRNIVKHFVEQTDALNLVGVCSNAIEAGNILSKGKVDLIFLDVEMPEMSGYDLIQSLSTSPEIILITAKKDHAAEAFDYDVTDYLVKPITYPRFLKAINKALKKNKEAFGNNDLKDLYVRSDAKIVKINLADVLYIEALADYIMIITSTGKHIVHSTMKGFQSRLPEEKFARVHRSYIVNLDKIETIENLNVVIQKKYIPIGAFYKESFMKRLNML